MTTHLILTLVGAAMVAFSAAAVFFGANWVTEPLKAYGVPTTWWPWLGAAKAAGAAGLVAGLAVPAIGTAATIGLTLYFTGAVITVVRARAYGHIPFPLLYLAPVAAAFVF